MKISNNSLQINQRVAEIQKQSNLLRNTLRIYEKSQFEEDQIFYIHQLQIVALPKQQLKIDLLKKYILAIANHGEGIIISGNSQQDLHQFKVQSLDKNIYSDCKLETQVAIFKNSIFPPINLQFDWVPIRESNKKVALRISIQNIKQPFVNINSKLLHFQCTNTLINTYIFNTYLKSRLRNPVFDQYTGNQIMKLMQKSLKMKSITHMLKLKHNALIENVYKLHHSLQKQIKQSSQTLVIVENPYKYYFFEKYKKILAQVITSVEEIQSIQLQKVNMRAFIVNHQNYTHISLKKKLQNKINMKNLRIYYINDNQNLLKVRQFKITLPLNCLKQIYHKCFNKQVLEIKRNPNTSLLYTFSKIQVTILILSMQLLGIPGSLVKAVDK